MSNRIEVKTSELTGPALLWAVAQAQGTPVTILTTETGPAIYDSELLAMAVDGGAEFKLSLEKMMIDELISVEAWNEDSEWRAEKAGDCVQYGNSPSQAVGRSFVEASYGLGMEVPAELARFARPYEPITNEPDF